MAHNPDAIAHREELVVIGGDQDHGLACGFGSAVLECVAERALENTDTTESRAVGRFVTLGWPDKFIKVGTRSVQMEEIGINAAAIAETARRLLGRENKEYVKT